MTPRAAGILLTLSAQHRTNGGGAGEGKGASAAKGRRKGTPAGALPVPCWCGVAGVPGTAALARVSLRGPAQRHLRPRGPADEGALWTGPSLKHAQTEPSAPQPNVQTPDATRSAARTSPGCRHTAEKAGEGDTERWWCQSLPVSRKSGIVMR